MTRTWEVVELVAEMTSNLTELVVGRLRALSVDLTGDREYSEYMYQQKQVT